MKIGILGNAAKAHVHRWAYWLNTRGHQVIVYTDKEPPPSAYYGGIKVIRPRWKLIQRLLVFHLKGGDLANNREKWKVYAPLVDEDRPDVLHAHEALAYGPTLAHFPCYPRVLTPWGPDIEGLAEGDTERTALVRQACESADLITTNGPGLATHWSSLTGVDAERFRLFSWGINRSLFRPRPDEEQLAVRQDLGLPPGAPIILSPRLAKPNYRIDVIMKSWRAARREAAEDSMLRDAILVVLRAGAGEEHWRALQNLAEDLGDRSIHLVSAMLKQEHLAALYSASSATIMVPETDLLALSLLECLACGSIPILADLPCYRVTVDPFDSTAKDRARGLYAGDASETNLVRTLLKWNNTPAETRVDAIAHNVDYIADYHDWNRCAPRMEGVLEEAIVRYRRQRL